MDKRTRTILMSAASVILIALGIFIIVSLASPKSASQQTTPVAGAEQYAPRADIELPLVQLEGTWRAEYNGTVFVASIRPDSIRIDLVSADGASMNYWRGTFKSSESAGQSIVSSAVESEEIVLSQAKSKTFAIENETLSFEFKGMGLTKIVELKRG